LPRGRLTSQKLEQAEVCQSRMSQTQVAAWQIRLGAQSCGKGCKTALDLFGDL